MTLDPITPELAQRIVMRDERDGDRWHADYPFEDELAPLRMLADRESAHEVFTMYIIREEGQAVGGFGFFGPPDETGSVEFGYGLIPSARGRGLASAAVMEGMRIAKAHGATRAIADTDAGNAASRRVLEKCGFSITAEADGKVFVERML